MVCFKNTKQTYQHSQVVKKEYRWRLNWQVRKRQSKTTNPEYTVMQDLRCNMCPDVRLEPPTGSSAMTLQLSSPVSPSLAWWRAAPTSSVCVLSTRLAWAAHPESRSRWLPWTQLTAPAWEVLQLYCMCGWTRPTSPLPYSNCFIGHFFTF